MRTQGGCLAVCMLLGEGISHADTVANTRQIHEDVGPAIVSVTAGLAKNQAVQRGSGIVIQGSSPPIVATAFHVVERMSHASFSLPSGRTVAVVSVVLEPKQDLAFLAGPANGSVNAEVDWKLPPTAPSQSVAVAGYRLGTLSVRPGTLAELPVKISKLLARGGRTTSTDFETFSLGSGEIYPGDSGGPLLDAGEHLVGLVLGTIQFDTNQGGPVHFGLPVTDSVPAADAFKPLSKVDWTQNHHPYGGLTKVNPTAVVLRAMAISGPLGTPLHATSETSCSQILREVADGVEVAHASAISGSCQESIVAMQALFRTKSLAWRALREALDLQARTIAVETAGRAHFQAKLVETSEKLVGLPQGVIILSDLCRRLGGVKQKDDEKCAGSRMKAQIGVDELTKVVPFETSEGKTAKVGRGLRLLLAETDAFGESALAEALVMEGVAEVPLSAPGVADLEKVRCSSCGPEWARVHAKVTELLRRGETLTKRAVDRPRHHEVTVMTDKSAAKRAEDILVTRAVLEGAIDQEGERASGQLAEAAELYGQSVDQVGTLQNLLYEQSISGPKGASP
jgi:hypothetical protein